MKSMDTTMLRIVFGFVQTVPTRCQNVRAEVNLLQRFGSMAGPT
jgi:hypothetical protein